MTSQARIVDWNSMAANPLERLRAVRDYANQVFGDESIAATWLGRAHRGVRSGLCAVGAACQTPEGFRETLDELSRIQRLGRREVQAVARSRVGAERAAT